MWGQPFRAAAALSGGVALDHANRVHCDKRIRDNAARKGGGSPKGLTPQN